MQGRFIFLPSEGNIWSYSLPSFPWVTFLMWAWFFSSWHHRMIEGRMWADLYLQKFFCRSLGSELKPGKNREERRAEFIWRVQGDMTMARHFCILGMQRRRKLVGRTKRVGLVTSLAWGRMKTLERFSISDLRNWVTRNWVWQDGGGTDGSVRFPRNVWLV